MSLICYDADKFLGDAATNSGWAALAAALRSSPEDAAVRFGTWGYSEAPDALADALERLEGRLAGEGVDATRANLAGLARRALGVLIVSDGTVDDQTPEEVRPYAFGPDQPRAPAGSPEGGQWTVEFRTVPPGQAIRGEVAFRSDEGYGRTEVAAKLNHKLRAGEELDEYDQEIVRNLDQVMSSNKLEDNLRLFHAGIIEKYADGAVNKGYLSVSVSPDQAAAFKWRGQLSVIEVPRGTHYAVGEYHERELILPRGGFYTRVGTTSEGLPIIRFAENPRRALKLDRDKARRDKVHDQWMREQYGDPGDLKGFSEGEGLPLADWSEAQRAYALAEGCVWRTINGRPVCIKTDRALGAEVPAALRERLEEARRQGYHTVMYHGTASGTEFDVPVAPPGEDYMLDRMIGAHYAADPGVASRFADPGETMGRHEKTLEGGAGRVMPFVLRGKGLTVQQRNEEVYRRRYGRAGVVDSDQAAIGALVGATAFDSDPKLFVEWVTKARNMPQPIAEKLYAVLKTGQPYPVEVDEYDRSPDRTLHGYVKDFDSGLHTLGGEGKRAAVKEFLAAMKEQGITHLRYENTSPTEVQGIKGLPAARSRRAFIVLDNAAVAPLLDPKFVKVGMHALAAESVGELAVLRLYADTEEQVVEWRLNPRTEDARSLYVSRPVLNADAIIAWAKSVGFATTLPAEDMHVTVCFSKAPVDWGALAPDTTTLELPRGERRLMRLGDDGAVVLVFDAPPLRARWQEFLDAGASWDYDGYRPHITISYNTDVKEHAVGWDESEHPRQFRSEKLRKDFTEGADAEINEYVLNISTITPYAGPIVLGSERFEPVEEDWHEGVKENTEQRFYSQLAVEEYAQRLKRDLDALEARSRRELHSALEGVKDAVLEYARAWGEGVPAKAVEEFKLPSRDDVQDAVRGMLNRAWDAGGKDARREVTEGRAKEYVGDWDESKHPRHAAGSEQGGEFASRDVASMDSIAVWREGQEYEGRLFGGAYDWSRVEGPHAAKGSSIRIAILQARGRYNAMRERLGLLAVENWKVRPLKEQLVQSLAPGLPVGYRYDRWYDRGTRSWIVQIKDRQGNQIGSSAYVSTKEEANRINVGNMGGLAHEFAYDPSQPRAPQGSAEGGQWTSKGALSIETKDTDLSRWPHLNVVGMGRAVRDQNGLIVGYVRKKYYSGGLGPPVGSLNQGGSRSLYQYKGVDGTFFSRRTLGEVHAELLRPAGDKKEYENEDALVGFYAAVPTFTPRAALRWLRGMSFWVSGILSEHLTNDIKRVILTALKIGTPLGPMIEQLEEVFEPYLGSPEIADTEQAKPYRLETIIRTNTTTAYNHGRLTQFVRPDLMPFLDGIRYNAILDERTTLVCRYLDQKVFRPQDMVDDPEVLGLLPANHYQCRSVVSPIFVGNMSWDGQYITPKEIEEARGLADPKFLAEAKGAWRAYVEWDEAKHPRQPTGSEQGGEFAPKEGLPQQQRQVYIPPRGNHKQGDK